jgi:hypothetical protein
MGYSSNKCDAFLVYSVKPWEENAGAVFGALHGQ